MPIKIDCTLQLWHEGDYFIAHAMPLDVMSAGKTEEEARDMSRKEKKAYGKP